jgi:hypothetical protein
MPPRGAFFVATGGGENPLVRGGIRAVWGGGGRRGEAHGGPEPASKRARDARITSNSTCALARPIFRAI